MATKVSGETGARRAPVAVERKKRGTAASRANWQDEEGLCSLSALWRQVRFVLTEPSEAQESARHRRRRP